MAFIPSVTAHLTHAERLTELGGGVIALLRLTKSLTILYVWGSIEMFIQQVSLAMCIFLVDNSLKQYTLVDN